MIPPKRFFGRAPRAGVAALGACLALAVSGMAPAAAATGARATAAPGAGASAASGTLYKVTRPDGSVLFTDQAPEQPRGSVTRMRLPRAGGAVPDPAAEQARRYWAEQDRAFQARHETRQAEAAREARLAEARRRAAAESATDPRLPRRLARPGFALGGYPGYPPGYLPGYPSGYPPGMHRDGASGYPGSLGHDPAGAAAGVASPYTSSPGAASGRGGGFIGSGFATSNR